MASFYPYIAQFLFFIDSHENCALTLSKASSIIIVNHNASKAFSGSVSEGFSSLTLTRAHCPQMSQGCAMKDMH